MSDDGGRSKRPGSRLLLALALAAGILAALWAGALAAEGVILLFGVSSTPLRIVIKVAGMAAALPAGFYVVERAFLRRMERRRGREGRP
jgi:hypothetical protein